MFYEYNHLGSPDYFKKETGHNFSFPPHLHQCFEVIVILSGEMRITVDGHPFLLQESEALLIFPNQIHELESNHSEHMLCIFSPRLVQAYATKLADKIPITNRFTPDEYLIRALTELEAGSSTTEKKGLLYSLCGQFNKTASYTDRQADGDHLLYRIFSFVETEFGGDCSLTKLSHTLGYDYAYLSRFFKKLVGISFNTYVHHYRLSHACYLMENSDQSILRCAMDSGYTSLRSFNRNFKEHFGLTPATYRQNLKNS